MIMPSHILDSKTPTTAVFVGQKGCAFFHMFEQYSHESNPRDRPPPNAI